MDRKLKDQYRAVHVLCSRQQPMHIFKCPDCDSSSAGISHYFLSLLSHRPSSMHLSPPPLYLFSPISFLLFFCFVCDLPTCRFIPLAIIGAKDFYSTFVDLLSEFCYPDFLFQLLTVYRMLRFACNRHSRLLVRRILRHSPRRTPHPIRPLPHPILCFTPIFSPFVPHTKPRPERRKY